MDRLDVWLLLVIAIAIFFSGFIFGAKRTCENGCPLCGKKKVE